MGFLGVRFLVEFEGVERFDWVSVMISASVRGFRRIFGRFSRIVARGFGIGLG